MKVHGNVLVVDRWGHHIPEDPEDLQPSFVVSSKQNVGIFMGENVIYPVVVRWYEILRLEIVRIYDDNVIQGIGVSVGYITVLDDVDFQPILQFCS